MNMYSSRNEFLAHTLAEKTENKILEETEKRLSEIPEAYLSPAARLIKAALELRAQSLD